MTEGSISGKLLRFAFPIFLGNLFQQLYNIVDSWVVGNYVGAEALASVSSAGSLIFLLTGFVNGVFVGASVIIARLVGERKADDLSEAVHTTIAFGFAAGIFLTVFGMVLSPWMLKLMGTPASVMPNSVLYFRLYFAGGLGIVMYNTCMGIFQAVGDSRHPLQYLIVASMINVVLDWLFVAIFGFGIAGAAVATVISQFVSAGLGFFKLMASENAYAIRFQSIRLIPAKLVSILKMGIPTGVQNSVIAFANVIVQTHINAFGAVAMAGCGSYIKIEGFVFLPIISFSVALTTFIGQNLGAGEFDRAKRGARFGIVAGVLSSEAIGVMMYIFAPYLIALFSREPDVIHYGVMQTRVEALFFCVLAVSQCIAGILRGAGRTTVPMIVMLTCWCVIRITYIVTAMHFVHDVRVVFWAYPLTWTLSAIWFGLYLKRANWMQAPAIS
ncbi:MAG: hypothetical protein PWP51_1352 [Clostridiales bacterium]|jgi:putative MATE family efflux protein|nr:hypothetical protein [Clostridiales bacterium]MDN5298799.1 hypothetical protein [Clostridiales bacterium]